MGNLKLMIKEGFYLKKDITNFSWGGKKPVKKTTKKKPVKKLKKGGVVNDPVDTNNNKTKNTNQNQKKQNLINMFINKNDKKTTDKLTEKQIEHILELKFSNEELEKLVMINKKFKNSGYILQFLNKDNNYIYFGKLIDEIKSENKHETTRVFMKDDGWFVVDRRNAFNCQIQKDENNENYLFKDESNVNQSGFQFKPTSFYEFKWGGKKSKTKKPVKKTTKKLLKKGGYESGTIPAPRMTYLQKAKIDRYHLTPPKIVFNSNECKIKHRFGENPNPIYMGQLSTVDGRNLKYTRQDVPGINETNIDKDKINRRVYLMNDGEFYLNVDYSPYPSQRCVLAYTGHKNLKVSPNLQNKSTNFYNKTNNRYKNIEVYEFNLRNIGNGFSPTGAGKVLKAKAN